MHKFPPETDSAWDLGKTALRWDNLFVDNITTSSVAKTVSTLENNSTPTVAGGDVWKTGGTTAITDFDDGVVGQSLEILAEHTITITDGTPIVLAVDSNYVMRAGDTLRLRMFNDQIWHEISRTVTQPLQP